MSAAWGRRSSHPLRRLGAAAALGLSGLSLPAYGQLGPQGSPIQTNDYAIDLFQGPVLASTRVIGMGGAYVAVAEFVEGNTQNPASPAVRSAFSFDHIDFDVGIGITFPSTVTGTDFFNAGKHSTAIPGTDQQSFVALEASGNLQFGPWGLGLALRAQQYELARSDDGDDRLESQIGGLDLQLARNFWDGQIVVGAGVRSAALSIVNVNATNQAEGTLFQTGGANYEVGGLLRPNGTSYRVGFAARGAIESVFNEDPRAVRVVYPGTSSELYLPNSVESPWELAFGFAYQFGRLFNPRFEDPAALVERTQRYIEWRRSDRERRRRYLYRRLRHDRRASPAATRAIDADLAAEEAMDVASLQRAAELTRERLKARYRELGRSYLLVSTALIVNGATANAVGVESFLERTVNRSGEHITYSPRLGLEAEALPHWVVLRCGSYYEPTRFDSNPDGGRLHATVGGDVKLGTWDVFGVIREDYTWRLRGAADWSRNYFGWGIAVGGWY